jgi:ribonuclease P protein component
MVVMKKYAFPRRFRLLKRPDFVTLMGKGRKMRTKHFTVICNESRETGPRLGIVASKKVGNAVKRNRIKRLIREYFRLNRADMSQSVDTVVIARPKIRIERYADIEEELREVL